MPAPEFTKTPASEHGWVYPRPDGTKAGCGGPRTCKKCRDELIAGFEAGEFGKALLANQYADPFGAATRMLEAMKGQLLIVLVNRLGGKVEIPAAEVDETGPFMMKMDVDQQRRLFTFTVSKKS